VVLRFAEFVVMTIEEVLVEVISLSAQQIL